MPRRRDAVGLAALSAAVLIATQLGLTYWFYLYVAWFLGPVLVAVLARGAAPVSPSPAGATAPAAARSPRPPRLSRAADEDAHEPGSSSAVSKRTDMCVTSERIACSLTTPMTPPRGPVIPTSLM